MNSVKGWLCGLAGWLGLTVVSSALAAAAQPAEPFDYFANSWQVLGLRDYMDGTRITPQNELLLADKTKLRLGCGPQLTLLSQRQTKTLLEGWLPIVLLHTEEHGVRYEFTLWATPLPAVKDWRAAFDGPTEGENFCNWIKVKATNRSGTNTAATVQLELVATNATRLERWSAPLAPGQRAEAAFAVPFSRVSVLAGSRSPGVRPHSGIPNELPGCRQRPAREARLWLERTARYWRGVLAKGAVLEVPCEKSLQALKAAHVCQLIASDHGVLHGGEGFYDEFYIRDGGYQMLELEEAGLWDAAARALDAYLQAQRPDGRFESQKNQFDANGQALWVLWQHWKITGDRDWLRRIYPRMRRAVEWLEQARRQAPPDSPFAGLLPAAPADGEFLWDGQHHIPGYDFWNLRGLRCAAAAAGALGETADAAAFEREAADYRKAIDAAWQRTGLPHFPPSWEKDGTHWGNTETLWPTELFARDDPRVAALLREVRERHGGGFVEGTIRWTGTTNAIHPYLSSYTTMASLVRGEHERFVEEYYWYLLHSSASQAFPEGIFYQRRFAWSDTLPHVTGAANFAFLLRHALVHERGEELHLLSGAPDWWLEPGREIRLERVPTHFGALGLRVRGTARGVTVKLDPPRRSRPERIVLHLPETRRVLDAPKAVTIEYRAPQTRRWDFPAVVALYQRQAGP